MATTAVYADEATPGDIGLAGGKQFLGSTAVVAANVGGTQATGTPLTAQLNQVTSTSGYSVVLPPSRPGLHITVALSTSAQTALVFPSPGDTINALAKDAAITMAARTSATFVCVVAGQWFTSPRVPS